MGLVKKSYANPESKKRQERRVIARLKKSKSGRAVLKAPEKFLSARVKAKTGAKLKKKGHAVTRTKKGTRFFAERQHATRLSFRESDQAIVRDYANRRIISYPLDDGAATLARIQKFYERKKPGEYITLRIGDKAPFNTALGDIGEFNRYLTKLEEEWRSRPKGHHPGPYLQIVEVHYDSEAQQPKATRRVQKDRGEQPRRRARATKKGRRGKGRGK